MVSVTHSDNRAQSILVPTDGSDAATSALVHALQLAEREQDAVSSSQRPVVHVLAVVDTTAAPMRFDIADVHELERLKERLVRQIASTSDRHAADVTTAIRRGRPAEEIRRYAETNDIDLIVLGRTGQASVSDRLLGSTTDRVVRMTTIPVVVVPGTEANSDR